MDNMELGRYGEDVAVRYLEAFGYEIVERNWRCKFGEADIVALDDEGTVVFVEVKTRRSVEAGIPEEAVTAKKRRRYERIAMAYLLSGELGEDVLVRFDIIGICIAGSHRAMIRHHKGCFDGSM